MLARRACGHIRSKPDTLFGELLSAREAIGGGRRYEVAQLKSHQPP
jgi:hypothetical protein